MSEEDLLNDSEKELKRALERLGVQDYEYACFHSQQCAELALKALLARYGNFVPEHNLVRLQERIRSKYNIRLSLEVDEMAELTKHYTAARYRDARLAYGITYTRSLAETCIAIAQKALQEVKRVLAS